MKSKNLMVFAAMAASFYLMYSCQSESQTISKGADTTVMNTDSLIKRGGLLVKTIGCDDCHTPRILGQRGPELDLTRRLSGHPSNIPVSVSSMDDVNKGAMLIVASGTAFIGGFGTTFAGNLTSDESGIGNWTEAQFKNSLVHGKYKGLDEERDLLPPMPWQNYAEMEDQDIKAIFAFLKSTQPINNIVPSYIPPGKR